MELKRLIETRWSCRFQSIETLLKTYSAVLNTLADVRDTHHSPERSALAAGYLLKLESFPFVLMLVIMERLMRVAFILPNALQDPELDLAAAVTLINNVVRQLTEMRECVVAMKETTPMSGTRFGQLLIKYVKTITLRSMSLIA
jgi:hypothetical protein